MTIIRWPEELLDGFDLPPETRRFLAEDGLPAFVDYPPLEFGIYDSSPDLVIGESGDLPLVVTRSRGEVYLENREGHRILINSSVVLLHRFLELIADARSLVAIRREMNSLDPAALESFDRCFWSQVLDDAEALE